MNDEKIFADEELTLPSLADELGISAHQLSEILNREIKKNFNTFINEYRVKEAKELLVDEPGRSILSVGIAAGFVITSYSIHYTKLYELSAGPWYRDVKGF